MSFRDLALPLARRGIYVVPVEPHSKRCRLKNWPELATVDPAVITSWDAEMPAANVGCVAKLVSQAMLDCDTPSLVERIERETGQKMPPTFTALSAGKRCPHLYFSQTDRSRALDNRKVPGQYDLKVNDSYVVGPGSVLATPEGPRSYDKVLDLPFAPFPDWLADWIETTSERPKGHACGDSKTVSDLFDIHAFLDHYGLNYTMSGNWYITDVCPVSRRQHAQSTRTGFYFDGSKFGFNCFASDCPGSHMTVGQVIHHLNKGDGLRVVLPYSGPIWPKPESAVPASPTSFAFPSVPGRIRDYVISPIEKYDGWFPRGRVSIVAGSSGAGKTSLVVDLLEAQSRCDRVFGHLGAGLPFLLVFADRGQLANEETLERLGLLDRNMPIAHIEVTWGAAAVKSIQDEIEVQPHLPAVVFIEGADMLVEDPNKAQIVSPFLKALQALAAHYHIAIILSVGAPKSKPKEQHSLKRDRVFGSQMWPRMSDTIVTLSQVGDGTGDEREMDVQHRNARSEHFKLRFVDGRLREAAQTHDIDVLEMWVSAVDWFTRQECVDAMTKADAGMKRSTIYDRLYSLKSKGKLEERYEKEKGVKQLRWVRKTGEEVGWTN